MAKEDLALALERHSTSKIQNSDDLWKLKSFGFRGEALAAASSVSQLTVHSRAQGSSEGYWIRSEFGSLGDLRQRSRDLGTTIEVEELFSNVPARLKFLKSAQSEVSQIKKVLKAIALSHPEVTFKLKVEGQMTLFFPQHLHMKDRAQDVLKANLYEVNFTDETFRLNILYSSARDTQKSSQNIWVFVQSRWVLDKSIQAAIMDAYRNLLMHGEYPTCVVRLEILPDLVDVNIHPTKSQVKFQNPSNVFRLVQNVLRKGLEQSENKNVESMATHFSQGVESSSQGQASFAESEGAFLGWQETQYKTKTFPPAPSMDLEQKVASPVEVTNMASKGFWSQLQVLGQANLTYILAQSSRALYLIDQHAAHERVLFEKIMGDWKTGRVEVQNYLIPLVLDFESHMIEALQKVEESLGQFGILFDLLSPESIAIRSGPAIMKESAISEALSRLVHQLTHTQSDFAFEKAMGDLAASLACHSAIRAGQSLSSEEMKALLSEMDRDHFSTYCPHGRPVYQEMTFTSLDREFGRIV